MATADPDSARGRDDLELADKLATIALSSPLVRRLSSEVLRYVARAGTVPPSDESQEYELESRPLLALPPETEVVRAVGSLLADAGALAADSVSTGE